MTTTRRRLTTGLAVAGITAASLLTMGGIAHAATTEGTQIVEDTSTDSQIVEDTFTDSSVPTDSALKQAPTDPAHEVDPTLHQDPTTGAWFYADVAGAAQL